MYVKSEIKNETKQLFQRGIKNRKFMQEIPKPLWIPCHLNSGLKQSQIASRILFYPTLLALSLYITITFFFYPRGGKMERKAFVFRLNCLYIQHLKYILFCCTLVSKCIRFY